MKQPLRGALGWVHMGALLQPACLVGGRGELTMQCWHSSRWYLPLLWSPLEQLPLAAGPTLEPDGAGCARLCPEPGTDNVSTHSTGSYLGVYYPLVLCKTLQVVKKSEFDLTKVLSVEGTRTKAPLWPGVAVEVSQHRGFLEETVSAGKELAAAGWVG